MLDDDNSTGHSTQSPHEQAAPGDEGTESDDTKSRRTVGRAAGPPATDGGGLFSPPQDPAEDDARTSWPAGTEQQQDSVAASTAATKSRQGLATRATAAPGTDSAPSGQRAGDGADGSAHTGASGTGDVSSAGDEADDALPTADLTFQAPPATALAQRESDDASAGDNASDGDDSSDDSSDNSSESSDDDDDGQARRRRRSRGGRRRRKSANDAGGGADGHSGASDGKSADTSAEASDDSAEPEQPDDAADEGDNGSLRRRRRRRSGEDTGGNDDDPENTVVKVREPRSDEDEISGVEGSARIEAKKQRRRDGRDSPRRRAPVVSEAEFLARRESVKREMVVREKADFTQIAVLEDDVLVEHYVARESQASLIGNVYLGVVQNVLPSMEAAFIDIGQSRNAVLYAGEVDWSTLEEGQQRKIEEALQPGTAVRVQVTKDPTGQKGARLTSQISLAGRYLVYVPNGKTHGISRKLPDTERTRLKSVLKDVLPEDTGVIVRTAAEGASEDQLNRDVTGLTARWEDIAAKAESARNAQKPQPQALYTEPDLVIKVVRDLFNEDFSSLVVQGNEEWDNISAYVQHVAPDLMDRVHRHESSGQADLFDERRVDEQISKALNRKVYLPSGGSLIFDRTEAMTVVDVNTGKFTGSGGNLEETVTKNNLEAAEEIVRQLRLRDLGGIIVIDFIDMVLESNRELVLRRLVECLGRDRTRHQVSEVTSLGLVQMTRKRLGTGLIEAFGCQCEQCDGRGVVVHSEPIEPKKTEDPRRGRRGGRKRGGNSGANNGANNGGNGGANNGANNGGNSGATNGGGNKNKSGGNKSGTGSGGNKPGNQGKSSGNRSGSSADNKPGNANSSGGDKSEG